MAMRFTNGRRSHAVLAAAIAAAAAATQAGASTLYWDVNTTDGGATNVAGGAADGAWQNTAGVNANWTLDPNGEAATRAYLVAAETTTTAHDVVFSAGTNATGPSVVTVSGTPYANSITIQEGSYTLTSNVVLGTGGTAASGAVDVASGSTLAMNGAFTSASAAFNKTGAGQLDIGGSFSFAGTYVFSGGTARITQGTAGGSGAAIVNGATVRIDAGATFDTNGRNETVATWILNGGTITNSDASNAGAQPTAGFATAANTGGYDLRSGTMDARMTGTGAINKTTAGTLTVSKGSSNTGTTTISGGRLVVTGALAVGAPAIQVNATGVLAGTGVATDAPAAPGSVGRVSVNSGGTIDPGTAADTTGVLLSRAVSTDGGFTVAAGATFNVDIGGAAAGTGYDRVVVTSVGTTSGPAAMPVALAGDLAVDLINGYSPADGQLFFVLVQQLSSGSELNQLGAIGGAFAGLADGSTFTADGTTFQISYAGDSVAGTFTGGNDVVLKAVVPEPATLTALVGLGSLALRRRRRA